MAPARLLHVVGRLWSALVLAGLACACAAGGDVESVDPLGPDGGAVYATTKCESKADDGSCNKSTCKEDQTSNCQAFAEACLKDDYHYSGTAKEGTCSRIL